jgi:hypothetical protein
VSALASSLNNTIISKDSIFIGEVGLGGEVRKVSFMEQRLREAEKMGVINAVGPKSETADKLGIQMKPRLLYQICSDLVVFSLASSFFTNAFFHRFSSFFGWFGVLLALFVFVKNARTCYHFLKTIDSAINAFVIFYVNSNHI